MPTSQQKLKIYNTFDIDGVIDFEGKTGIFPGPDDLIITGRSIEEKTSTNWMLIRRRIPNAVFYNPLPFDQKTRITSGQHKGNTLLKIRESSVGWEHGMHFEDDPIQIEEILKIVPDCRIVHVKSNFVELENVRR